MKSKYLLYFIIISISILSFSSCGKKDRLKREIPVKTFRENTIKMTVEECIQLGIIGRGMTMKECNNAITGTFQLKTKLEDDWAIYTYNGLNIFFKGEIAMSKQDLQISRIKKILEEFKKQKEQKNIEDSTTDPYIRHL